MTPLETLTDAIDSYQHQLRASLPADSRRAVVALSRHLDDLPPMRAATNAVELALCVHRPDLGGQVGLQVLLEARSPDQPSVPGDPPTGWQEWAAGFLHQCRQIEMARLLRLYVESGYMRLEQGIDGSLEAWIGRRHIPARLRERADFEWRRFHPSFRNIDGDPVYRLDYPPETVLGGTTVALYQAVIERLRTLVQDHVAGFDPIPELHLASLIVEEIGTGIETVLHAIQPMMLTAENAAWHATLPGVAIAPLVHVPPDGVLLSRRGLSGEPYLFIARELRRQDAAGYHDAAHHREQAFRDDLHERFSDRRFVQSPGRIVLRRADGTARTDIDAAIFDRKTGTLALFELKSLDPFARTAAELQRQRDSVLYANRQVSGMLDWIKRYGGDDILNRIDRQTAKTFRVQRVLPFVLCRHLARFDDGPPPDARAAWASWPGVLRVVEQKEGRSKEPNPLAALFQRLRSGAADPGLAGESHPVDLDLDRQHIRIYPSADARNAAG